MPRRRRTAWAAPRRSECVNWVLYRAHRPSPRRRRRAARRFFGTGRVWDALEDIRGAVGALRRVVVVGCTRTIYRLVGFFLRRARAQAARLLARCVEIHRVIVPGWSRMAGGRMARQFFRETVAFRLRWACQLLECAKRSFHGTRVRPKAFYIPQRCRRTPWTAGCIASYRSALRISYLENSARGGRSLVQPPHAAHTLAPLTKKGARPPNRPSLRRVGTMARLAPSRCSRAPRAASKRAPPRAPRRRAPADARRHGHGGHALGGRGAAHVGGNLANAVRLLGPMRHLPPRRHVQRLASQLGAPLTAATASLLHRGLALRARPWGLHVAAWIQKKLSRKRARAAPAAFLPRACWIARPYPFFAPFWRFLTAFDA